MVTEHDITLRQGSSERITVRWETEPYVYAAIQSISRAAPAVITTQAAHEIPGGWRVAVVDAQGMTQLNAKSNPPAKTDFRRARVRSGTQIEFNDLSSAAFGAHKTGTGYLQWLTPHPLQDFEARMDIKDRVGGTTLMTLNTDNGGIVLSDAEKTISLVFNPADTEGLTWRAGVYDLEMIAPGGTVTSILAGSVELVSEVTTSS